MILIKQHSNTQLYMYPPPRRKQKIKKSSTKQQQKRLAVHPNTTASSQTQPTRRQQRASPSTSNTIRIHSNPTNQATATRLAVRIQHHPHPHTSAQPHTSNTAAYIHKSTTSHRHNQELLKKARGVCRGAVALRPLCGFHFFPKLNHRLINKFLFFVSF